MTYDGSCFGTLALTAEPEEIAAFVMGFPADYCLIERVWARPGEGNSSAFNFGTSYGECRMAAALFPCKPEYITPQKWQKELGLIVPKTELAGLTKSQAKTYKKNKHKEKVWEVWGIKPTLRNVDALLLVYLAWTRIARSP